MKRSRKLTALVVAATAATCVCAGPAAANPYTPSGTIVADSGFRPDANGYSFSNYTNEGDPQNLDAAAMQKLFGSAVCAGGGDGGGCTLTPSARAWKEAQNKGMGGGHCEGMAISSSFFYAGVGDPSSPSPFGSATVPGLGFDGNSALQGHIAYTFVFQFLPAVSSTKVNGSPAEVLDALIAGLPTHEPMVLGVYQRGFKGGHAITPLAVEDRGGGVFAVLVYDNNFPNAIREVVIDRNANTWNYSASTNPSEPAGIYEGDASSKTLEIEYARRGIGEQPCPFCGRPESARSGVFGAEDDTRKAQLIWSGDPRDGQHSEVSIVDEEGNEAGCSGSGEDRECVDDIPGAELIHPKLGGASGEEAGVDVWLESAPPVFELPSDLDFEVAIDGGDLEGRATEGFSLVRNGVTFTLDGLDLEEGDEQSFAIADKAMTVSNGSDHEIEPTIGYGDVTGGTGYDVTLRTRGLDADATIDLSLRPGRRALKVELDSEDGEDAQVTTLVRRIEGDGDVDTARSRPTTLDAGETGRLSYGAKPFRDGKLDFGD